MVDLLTGILTTAVAAGAVLAIAGMGELLGERVGIFNLGLEGLMSLGAVMAVIVVNSGHGVAFGLVAVAVMGLVVGAIFAFGAVVLRADQVLCGIALTFAGVGFAAWIGRPYAGQPVDALLEPIAIPVLNQLPIVGPALFRQNALVYLGYFVLPVLVHLLLFNTRHGIELRAVGENPAAADAAGVRVMAIRYCYVMIGSALAAVAGAYLTLAYVPAWSEGLVAGRGWIALGLVAFANFMPLQVMVGAILFGLLSSLGFAAQANGWPVPSIVFIVTPYVGTVLFLFVRALSQRRGGRLSLGPAALGLPYFRDER
ncbi:MAG: ABC transporter permease [Parvibaculaceae bacterium]